MNNLILARHRHSLKLSTSLKTAMAETETCILSTCLEMRDRNEKFKLTAVVMAAVWGPDHLHIDTDTCPTPCYILIGQ